jgi:hypothetical protein
MYQCDECKMIFEYYGTYSEDFTPGGASEGGNFIQTFRCCPYCQGDYHKVQECWICGDYHDEKDMEYDYDDETWICEKCNEEEDI